MCVLVFITDGTLISGRKKNQLIAGDTSVVTSGIHNFYVRAVALPNNLALDILDIQYTRGKHQWIPPNQYKQSGNLLIICMYNKVINAIIDNFFIIILIA